MLKEFASQRQEALPNMGSLNLEGKPLPRRRTQRQEARIPSHSWTCYFRAGKMKAAVFAALATTAAAFAPVARPLATAAATKLSVVPETVAELPSMLTALPTLTAPQEGDLFFTSPFLVAFFVLSSAFGWPVLAALRLNSLEE